MMSSFLSTWICSPRLRSITQLSGLRAIDAGLGVLKEVLLTRAFGLGPVLDAYFMMVSLVDLFAGYVLQMSQAVFLPAYVASPASKNLLLSVFVNYVWLFLGLLALFFVLLPQPVVHGLFGVQSADVSQYLFPFITLALPLVLLSLTSNVFKTVLIQNQRFAWYYMPDIIATLMLIIIFYVGYPQYGFWALLWGYVLAQVVQLMISFKLSGAYLQWQWSAPDLQGMQTVALLQTGVWLLFYLFAIVDNMMLARLAPGDLSAFRYASSLVLLLGALTVSQQQMTLMPVMMTATARQEYPVIKALLRQGVVEIVALALPIIALATWLSPWVVQLLFQRGAFHAQDTQLVTQCFQVLLWLMPSLAGWSLAHRCLSGLTQVKPLLVMGAGFLLLRITTHIWASQHYQLLGVTYSVVLNQYIIMLVGLGYVLYYLKRQTRDW